MIRIDRSSTTAPKALTDAAPAATNALAQILQTRPLTTDDFEKRVYGSDAVKRTLWKMQHAKCCFCEKPSEAQFGTVEHFRPKTSALRSRSSSTRDAGYWWLGYAFDNLYFCCPNCNTFKNDYFPLAPGSAPLTPHQAPPGGEDALLLDPGSQDAADHITFVPDESGEYRITAKNASVRGRETIDAARLDRDDLHELREFHRMQLTRVANLVDAARGTAHEPEVAALARELCEPTSPYALLARVYLRDRGVL